MSAEDKEDESKNNEDRARILQLQSERARKQEVLERLQEKRKALEEESRNRADDLRVLQEQKIIEERKQRERSDTRQKDSQDEAVDQFMKVEMRTMLKERIPAFSLDSINEDEEDSDGEDKDKKNQEGEPKNIHGSVLVSYIAEKPLDRDKLDEYYVTYRIDADTTMAKLHKDCCEFWGCSPEEYYLCQMSPGQNSVQYLDNLMDKKAEEKVQNTDILPAKWRAHLHLIQKKLYDNKNERLANREWNPFDDYGSKKGPSSGGAVDSAVQAVKASQSKEEKLIEEPFAVAFQGWPGIYKLIRYRQRPPTRQWSKIKLRDVVIYFVLIILSCLTTYMRSRTSFFIMRQGLMQTLVTGFRGETDPLFPSTATATSMNSFTPIGKAAVQDFSKIRTHDEIWKWLGGPFAYQLFDVRSSFSRFYKPVGFLRIRQQRAKERFNDCRREEVPLELRGRCYYLEVKPDTQEKDFLIIDQTFIDESKPNSGRSDGINPREWRKSEDYSVHSTGEVQLSYDGSGYVVDYDIQSDMLDNTYSTWLQDLPSLQQLWVNKNTRMLSIEFTVANYNLGGFMQCSFLFELPASGSVNPLVFMSPLHIGEDSYRSLAGIIDIARGLIVLYIAFIKIYFETTWKTASGKSGFNYIFSFNGLVDECTVAIFAAMAYMYFRHDDMPDPAKLKAFYSYSFDAYVQEQLFVCEGIFFLLIMLRFCSYMVLNPMVLQIWRMFKQCINMYKYYLFVFIPVFFAAVFMAHCIYSPYVRNISTWYDAFITLVFFIKQDTDIHVMQEKQRFWTLPYILFFFLTFSAFFLNGFLAIAVHSYFEVKLADVAQKEKGWSRDQWMDWTLSGPVYKCLTGKEPGSSKGKGDGDDDDGDEDGDDDDDDEEKED